MQYVSLVKKNGYVDKIYGGRVNNEPTFFLMKGETNEKIH